MIRAIFFDVDGTLLSHKTKVVSKQTRLALQQLRNNNILTFMCTGRHVVELEELAIQDIPFDGYITLNGQLCLDADKHIVHGTPFSDEMKDALLQLFNDKTYPLFIVEEDRIYTNFIDDVVKQAQQNVSTSIPQIDTYRGKAIYQASAFIPRELDACLQAKLPSSCKLARWGEDGVDIFTRNGGKVEGMQYFMKQYNITQDEIMAFGDADNDMEMLEFASIGVAMGNARQQVKDIADYVTLDVEEDGIYHALKHFSLI